MNNIWGAAFGAKGRGNQAGSLEDFKSVHQAARRAPVPSCSRRSFDGATIVPGVLRRVRLPCRYRGRSVGAEFDHEWPCAAVTAAWFDVLVVGSRTSVGGGVVVAAECILNASDKFTKSSAVVGGDGSIATITAVVAVAAEAAAGATNIAFPPELELVVVVVVLILLFLLIEMMVVVVLMVIIIRRFGHLQDRTGSCTVSMASLRDSLCTFTLTFGCSYPIHRRSGIDVIILHSSTISSMPYSIMVHPRPGGLPPPQPFCSPTVVPAIVGASKPASIRSHFANADSRTVTQHRAGRRSGSEEGSVLSRVLHLTVLQLASTGTGATDRVLGRMGGHVLNALLHARLIDRFHDIFPQQVRDFV